jgi:hypothetical protein
VAVVKPLGWAPLDGLFSPSKTCWRWWFCVRRHGDLDKNIAGRTIFLRSYRHVRRNMLNEVLIPPKLIEPGKNLGLLKLKIWSKFQIWWIHFFVYNRQLWFWKAQNWRKRICELANCNMSSILSLRGVWTLWTPQKWSGFRPQSKVELASKGPKWYATVAVYPANMIEIVTESRHRKMLNTS